MTKYSLDIRANTELEATMKLKEAFPDATNITISKRKWKGNFILFTASFNSKEAIKYT